MHLIRSLLRFLPFFGFVKQESGGVGGTAAVQRDSQGLAHRHDIDGLRAVAVLPVLAFHAGITLVPGGFVGVDVFFVISGFLISSMLLKEIEAGQFSILKFYERRVRRIFPALFVVLIATFLIAWVYSLPSELVDLSKASMAAWLSVSNIYFWLKAGYFDGSALSQPLLHTWSLAVEEQFYIFWPLYLLVAFRYSGARPVRLTIWVALASFVLCIVGTYTYKDATYYMVLTRGWELLLGGLVAFGLFPTLARQWQREVVALLGLAMIVATVFLINGDMAFPGVLALPPTLGAAMLIGVGSTGQTFVGRLLSLRPVVFIGLISYSLYLWHWPIAVFQRNSSLLISVGPDWVRKVAIIVVSIIAAYLSWKYVEQPMRTGKYKPSPRLLAKFAVVATVAVVALSATMWAKDGAPQRYSPQQIEFASYLNFDPTGMFRDGQCFLRERVGSPQVAADCLQVDAAKKNYLILGDSHAAQLWWGLKDVAPGINFAQLTAVGCLPTVTPRAGEVARCQAAMGIAFDTLAAGHSFDKVIIAGRWTPASFDEIDATLAWAAQHNVKVILVGPSVIYDSPLPRLLVTAQTNANDGPDQHWDKSLIALDKNLATLAAQRQAEYFSLIDAMCPTEGCISLTPDGKPMVFDREHFTEPGSRVIAEWMLARGVLQP